MACAEVAAAKAKTTAINLIILFSYGNLEEAFIEARCSGAASRLWRKARVARRAPQHSVYEPRLTTRKWVDVPTFSGGNPVAKKRSVSSGDVPRDLYIRREMATSTAWGQVRPRGDVRRASGDPRFRTWLTGELSRTTPGQKGRQLDVRCRGKAVKRDCEVWRSPLAPIEAREVLSVGSGFVSIYQLHPETAKSRLLPSGGA